MEAKAEEKSGGEADAKEEAAAAATEAKKGASETASSAAASSPPLSEEEEEEEEEAKLTGESKEAVDEAEAKDDPAAESEAAAAAKDDDAAEPEEAAAAAKEDDAAPDDDDEAAAKDDAAPEAEEAVSVDEAKSSAKEPKAVAQDDTKSGPTEDGPAAKGGTDDVDDDGPGASGPSDIVAAPKEEEEKEAAPAAEEHQRRDEANDEKAEAAQHVHVVPVEEEEEEEKKEEEAWPPYCDPSYVMPDTLEITMFRTTAKGGREEEVIMVDVERASSRKPYLGGYRHKRSGLVYHHASSQSEALGLLKRQRDVELVRNRDTQTYEMKTRSVQSTREYGTQMDRVDLDLDTKTDRTVDAKRYFSAAQVLEFKRIKTLVIQCYWRGYRARKRTWALRQRLYEHQLDRERRAEAETAAAQRKRHFEVERRINPRTCKDFGLLYNELEHWRQAEMDKIHARYPAHPHPDSNSSSSSSNNNKSLSSTTRTKDTAAAAAAATATTGPVSAAEALSRAERRRAVDEVLAKETKALQTIDKLKAQAARDGKTRRVQRELELMAAPKRWETGSGEIHDVQTPFTTRAAELFDLYRAVHRGCATRRAGKYFPHNNKTTSIPTDDRLDTLLNVKWTAQEFDCALTRDIVELCDREADLLSRGRSEKSLEGLRLRLSNLFLQFVETPDFNPESTRFLRVPTLRHANTLTTTAMVGD